ncbi:MAG: PAS domain S-box protein [Desulfuromonadaceae bacterium]|nr:PAS domain S-box protein [Desulfuromonadaceae bacterium]
MAHKIQDFSRFEIIRIVAVYSVFGSLWIYLSDRILGTLINNPATITQLSMYKGVLFIFLTAVLLYFLIARYLTRISRQRSDLTRAEKMLQVSEDSFKAMVDKVPLAIHLTTGIEQTTHYINPSMITMFGYTKEDIPSVRQWWPLAYPEEKYRREVSEEWNQRVAYAIKTQTTIEPMETVVRCKDGTTRDILWGYITLGDKNYSYGLDLTERKKAEAALLKSKYRWEFAIEGSGDGVWDWNIKTNEATYSRRWTEMLGYAESDILPSHQEWLDRIHPDDQSHVARTIQDYLDGLSETYVVEYRLKCKDQSYKWILGRGMVVSRSEDGKPVRMIGTHTDITDRKNSEDFLAESREKYRCLSEAAYEAIFISEKGICLEQNKRAEELFGYTNDEAVGRPGTEWIVPEDRILAMKNMLAGYEQPYEVTGLRKDGTTFPALIRGKVMNFKDRTARVTSLSDITDRKEREKELVKNEKLESLGVLAGGIAHDFNNILTGIMGNISFAQMFIDTTHKAYKPLAAAERASVRAGELAHQLLTFARGGDPVKKVVSLQHVVNETVSLVLRGSNIKGCVDIADSVHAINADEGQMSQVFNNITINAAQAMPGGGILSVCADNVTLSIVNGMSLSPGTYIRVAITDQGCGISAHDLKKIFDPYFTTKPTGNGLGLASVHSIIHRHGGHIDATSTLGKGTTFTIHLPSIGETYVAHQTESVIVTSGAHAGGSILVMDDEVLIRDMVAEMLCFLGYQVTTCEDGTEAVMLYKAAQESGEPFSAVIMDLTIPGGMGGREAAQEILGSDPKACLIVSSGYSNDPTMSDFRSFGFSAAANKPYNLGELEQQLRSALSLR